MISYEKLFRQYAEALAFIDSTGRIIEINESFRKLFPGIEHSNFNEYIPLDYQKSFENAFKKVLENIPSGFDILDSFHIDTKPSYKVELYPFEKDPVIIFAVIRDITEIKRNENALIASTTGWRLILDSITDPICLTDPDGQIIRVNTKFASTIKEGFHEVLGKSLFSYFPVLSGPHEKMRNGTIPERYHGEFEWSGRIFRLIADPYRSGTDKISGVIYIFQDITEEKKAASALKETEFRLSEIMDAITSPIFFKNLDNVYLACNKAFCEFIGLPKDRIVGHSIINIFPKEKIPIYQHRDDELIRTGGMQRFEAKDLYADGIVRDIIVNKALIMNSNNECEGIVGILVDISDLKKAEEKIEANLREKEVLLKEIHHRVKNNLNIIGSLLGLKRDKTNNPVAKDALNESMSRVYSMALIHEKLYRSGDLSMIQVRDYLDSLSESIFSNYSLNYPVKLEKNYIDIYLDIVKMIPLGLVLNELMTNSMKYAFRDKKGGIIKIDLEMSGTDRVKLVYQDNGPGIPEDIDLNNPSTLGMQLIRDLTKQLHGKVSIIRNRGAKFEIEFPIKIPEKR